MSTIKTRPFDMAHYLGNEEEVAEYLRQVMADAMRPNWVRPWVTLRVRGA